MKEISPEWLIDWGKFGATVWSRLFNAYCIGMHRMDARALRRTPRRKAMGKYRKFPWTRHVPLRETWKKWTNQSLRMHRIIIVHLSLLHRDWSIDEILSDLAIWIDHWCIMISSNFFPSKREEYRLERMRKRAHPFGNWDMGKARYRKLSFGRLVCVAIPLPNTRLVTFPIDWLERD